MRYFSLLNRWTEAILLFPIFEIVAAHHWFLWSSPPCSHQFFSKTYADSTWKSMAFQISPEMSLKTIAFAYFHAGNTFSFWGVPHLQHLCKEWRSRLQDHSHQAHTKHFITVMQKYFVTKHCAMGSGPSEQIVMKCKSKSWLSIQLVHLSNRTIEIYCAVASSIQKIHHYQSIHVCQCANVG